MGEIRGKAATMHKPENPMLFVLVLWLVGIALVALMWLALTMRTG